MDILTIIGVLLGLGAVVGGMLLEGGTLHSISQLTAAVIVIGGTLGAVFVTYPSKIVIAAIKNGRFVFMNSSTDPMAIVNDISLFAAIARKDGLLALENRMKTVSHPFLKKGLQLVVDGTEPALTREILEIDMEYSEEYNNSSARVYESAGGYAPTIGILGAVLGLIHVMENLAEPDKLGAGIAVAFVATIYGVGSANLLWLPIAGKIKVKLREEMILNELITEGLVGLSEGENPRRLEEKLVGFLRGSEKRAAA
jgi:chemotaxis protein MotA